MMRSRWIALAGVSLAALISNPVWGSTPPQPGTINYIEGQASIGAQALNDKSAGSTVLAAGQSLSTGNGRAEILLTPGVFLRVDHGSSVRMIDPGLADTVLAVDKGRALVEVGQIRPENNLRIEEGGASARVGKPGLYDFDAEQGQIRVFDGKAQVRAEDRLVEVKGGHEVSLDQNAPLKAQKFDKKAEEGDLYRWSSLRSGYLSEANLEAARRYAGAYGPGWYGAGWYWDPWFSAYTFIPADGVFFNPFGWGFYSPWYVYTAPSFVYAPHYGYYRHFGPGYHPLVPPSRTGAPGFARPAPGFHANRSAPMGGFRGFGGGRRR